jgi:hypothetical protein
VETLSIEVASDLTGFTDKAMEELHTRVQQFTEDLIHQAAREEQEYRAPDSDVAQITPTHVIESNRAVRGIRRLRRPPSLHDAALAVAVAVSAGSAGAFAQMMNSNWQSVMFGLSFGAGAIFTWITARRSR